MEGLPQFSGFQVLNANPGSPDPANLAGATSGADIFERLRAASKLRSLTPLPKRTEEIMDDQMIEVGLDRLTVAGDLIEDPQRRRLLPNWMAIPTLTAHKRTRAGRAAMAMVPTPSAENSAPELTPYTLPIYATFAYFSYDIRVLLAAARVGYQLDTNAVREATLNVNETIEDVTINGGPTINGFGVNGYQDTTNTSAYSSGTSWTTATGSVIVTNIINMNGVLENDSFRGAKDLYINGAYNNALNRPWSDGVTTFDKTIRQYLEGMSFGGQNLRIRVADQLGTDRTFMVDRTTPGVARMLIGQQAQLLSFDSLDGMTKHFYVIACMVPDVQSNSSGNFGIVSGFTS
jgi:hypothetical protein